MTLSPSPFSSQIIHLEVEDFNKNDLTFKPDHSGKPVLVFVYADWCGHCTSVKPNIIKLNEEFKRTGNAFVVAVNSDDTDLVALLEVSSYPSFFKIDGPSSRLINISNAVGDRSCNSLKTVLFAREK